MAFEDAALFPFVLGGMTAAADVQEADACLEWLAPALIGEVWRLPWAFNCEVHSIASRTVVTEKSLYKSNECSDCPSRRCSLSLSISAKMSFTIVLEENVTIELPSDLRALRVESPFPNPRRPAELSSDRDRAFVFAGSSSSSANHKQQLVHQAVQASHGQDQQQPQGIGNGNNFALHNSPSHLANALTPDETLLFLFRAQSPDLSGKHEMSMRDDYDLPGAPPKCATANVARRVQLTVRLRRRAAPTSDSAQS